MKIFKRFLTVLTVLLSLAGCKTYDQSFDWVEGTDIEGFSLSVAGIGRGVVEFSLTNNNIEEQTAVILPQSSIIGYRKDLDRTTNKARNPGKFKGDPHVVRAIGGNSYSDKGLPNIYGSFNLSYNDVVIPPGETVYTQLFLNNWDRATENFIARVYILVREGDVRNRTVLELPAEFFFNTSSSLDGSGSMLKINSSVKLNN